MLQMFRKQRLLYIFYKLYKQYFSKATNKDFINIDYFKSISDHIIKSESYNFEKINSLFKNFDTLSFPDVVLNYQKLLNNGYSKNFLSKSLHSMLTLPFFLFFMTALVSIFAMNSLKKSDNFKLIVLGLITCVSTFYFKDLSLALGQTGRISLILSVWSPIIVLSLFAFIGLLQINEK